jgi:AraC-like DNA-binding protein
MADAATLKLAPHPLRHRRSFAIDRREAQVSARLLWVFARVSRENVRQQEILLREGIGPIEYFDPETRLRHRLMMDLLKLSVDAGDVEIGLRAGESVQPGDFATLEYAARSCPTLGDAIRCFSRYVTLLHEAAEISLIDQGELVMWRHRITDGVQQSAAANDFVMAASSAFAKTYCHVYAPPLEVHFAHREPTYGALYQRIFQTTVRFGAPHNAFVLRREDLETPLTRSHPVLRSEYEKHAAAMLSRVHDNLSIAAAVRRVFLADPQMGGCTMATTAGKLAMSVATLRRRLQDEGVTYASVLDALRYDLARKYLIDPGVATSDVAFLLGFRDASSFSKAFRRWTRGVSPVEFRQPERPRAQAQAR